MPSILQIGSTPKRTGCSSMNALTSTGLVSLGFKAPARRTIEFPADNPYFDMLLVSRHERARELWNKTNPEPDDPQMSLLS